MQFHLVLISLVLIALRVSTFAAIADASRPNIHFILTDDPGSTDVGLDEKEFQAPNLDEDLAESKILASLHPDRVQAMQTAFEELIRAGRSTSGAPQKSDVPVKRYPSDASAAPKKNGKSSK